MAETMGATWKASTWQPCPTCGIETVVTQGFLGRVDSLFERGKERDSYVYHSPRRCKALHNTRR